MRVPVAVFRGLDSAGTIRAIRRLRAEGETEWVGRRASGGHSLVVPVQTAGFPHLNDLANLWRLHRLRLRAVHLQGLVAAPAVVVGEVSLRIRRRCRSLRTTTWSRHSRRMLPIIRST
jgi:hypothetical protein